MDFDEIARTVMSGAYERRRGYLSGAITAWNQLAVTASVAIWGFLVQWEVLIEKDGNWEMLAIQAGWAGALSSVLIGASRLYAHYLDYGIVRLYPVLYLCERALLPAGACTIRPPRRAPAISASSIPGGLRFVDTPIRRFKGRAHIVVDVFAAASIVVFAIASLSLGWRSGRVTMSLGGTGHMAGWLLLGNALGLALLLRGIWLFVSKRIDWPVPSEHQGHEPHGP